jgi:hypothetical protein
VRSLNEPRADRQLAVELAALGVLPESNGMNHLLDHVRAQVHLEEPIQPLPRVAHYEAAVELVIFAGIHHEAHDIALPRLEQVIHQHHRVNERHVHVGGAVQDQQRMLHLTEV